MERGVRGGEGVATRVVCTWSSRDIIVSFLRQLLPRHLHLVRVAPCVLTFSSSSTACAYTYAYIGVMEA